MTKKILKIILIALVSIVVIVGGGLTLLTYTVDQNTIKDKIVELVREKTGRELKIEGNVNWTIFPWLGVRVRGISFSNPHDFKDQYFAKAKELSISVKLMPLIFERCIEATHLTLKDLDVQLITNSVNKNNWEDLLSLGGNAKPATITENKKFNSNRFLIGNIAINNGNIFWYDQKAGRKIGISQLNLSCKDANFKKPFALKVSFRLSHLHPFLDGAIDAQTQISLDTANVYKLKDLKLRTDNVLIVGSLQITNATPLPKVDGNLIISDTGSKALAKLLDIPSQKQPNSSFKVIVELSPQAIKIPSIQANLDDMVLKGNASYAANSLGFDILLNKLDLNVFNTAATKVKTSTVSVTNQSIKTHVVAQSVSSSSPNFLKAIKMNGNLKIGAIHTGKVDLTNFTTSIIGSNGVFSCQKLSFDLYQSRVLGSATIDLRNPVMQTNLRLAVTNTPMRLLLIDLAKYDKFSGSLSFNTNINIRGQTTKEMFNSVSGSGNIMIANGAYTGVDVPYEVRRVHAMLNAKPSPQKPDPPRTKFDKLAMNFNITNALLTTNDLLIQSPDYKITGGGKANLVSEQLDLALNAYSMHDKNFFLPVKVTGAFNNPSVRIDAAVMLQHEIKKVVADVIQKQVEKNLPNELKKILPLDKLLH